MGSPQDPTTAEEHALQAAAEPQRTIFSSLPLELREKIWNSTFEPRLLSIYMHEGQTPIEATSAAEPYFDSQPRKVACVVFTAAEGKDEPYDWQDFVYPQRNFKGYFTIASYMKVRLPRGPIALEVCHESRKVALKRYELAFAGINLVPRDEPFEVEWKKGRFGEKRIWVDFKNDVLFIWNAERQVPTEVTQQQWPHRLELFARYVPEETAKIRRLGISGAWDITRQTIYGPGPGHYNTAVVTVHPSLALLKSTVTRGIKLFGGLKELLVWSQEAVTCAPVRGAEAERVRGEIVDVLTREKERFPEWAGPLPLVSCHCDDRLGC